MVFSNDQLLVVGSISGRYDRLNVQYLNIASNTTGIHEGALESYVSWNPGMYSVPGGKVSLFGGKQDQVRQSAMLVSSVQKPTQNQRVFFSLA